MPDFSQSQMLALFRPVLDTEGVVFEKKQNVFAKKAEVRQVVTTQTDDGPETVNTAEVGDYLVKNQTAAGEMYVVKADKFAERYERLDADSSFVKTSTSVKTLADESADEKEGASAEALAKEGFEEYRSIGRITAVELTPERCKALNLPPVFHFKAPWKEDMVAKVGDFIACPPDDAQVYRIARKEFFETYEAVGEL